VVAHFLAALTGELPSGVESDYIRRLFDDFAGHFESTLVGKLGYATPARLAAFIRANRLAMASPACWTSAAAPA
jgi:predicted TPR repeat methyltransferase